MRLIITAAVFAGLGLAYGFGIGRYEWPPSAALRGLRHWLAPAVLQFDHVAAQRHARLQTFKATPGEADVIMLGDSLTEQGNWSELLPGVNVWNRGIGGDRTADVLARLPEVTSRKPRLVFLMVGINDIRHGADLAKSAQNVRAIVGALRENRSSVILQSVLPVGSRHSVDLSRAVASLNDELAAIAREQSATFLDLRPHLAPDGKLPDAFTWDGLHLGGAAYVRWRDALLPVLSAQSAKE